MTSILAKGCDNDVRIGPLPARESHIPSAESSIRPADFDLDAFWQELMHV